MKFEKYTLHQLAVIKYGKDSRRVASCSGVVPIYGTGGLLGYATKPLHDKPSVLIGRKGTIGTVRYVDRPFWTIDTLFYTVVNEEKIIPRFFYFLMSQLDLNMYNEGTAVPSLRKDTLDKLEFDIPPISTQKKIAAILGALDDKIELNLAINRNLEEQMDALFAHEFLVDKQLLPGWERGNLLDIADYLNGLAMQKNRPKRGEHGLPVLKIRELRQGFCDASSEECSPFVKDSYIVHDGDVIFSWSGSLLVDIWCGGTCGLNQHLFKVTSQKYDKWFYYAWTKHYLERFVTVAADKATTMGHIKRDELSKAKVLIPPPTEYERIGALLSPLCELIISNRVEARRLTALRDTLLPRLMSGEPDVSECNI